MISQDKLRIQSGDYYRAPDGSVRRYVSPVMSCGEGPVNKAVIFRPSPVKLPKRNIELKKANRRY